MGVGTLPTAGLEGRRKGGRFGTGLASRRPLLTAPSAGEPQPPNKGCEYDQEEGTFTMACQTTDAQNSPGNLVQTQPLFPQSLGGRSQLRETSG